MIRSAMTIYYHPSRARHDTWGCSGSLLGLWGAVIGGLIGILIFLIFFANFFDFFRMCDLNFRILVFKITLFHSSCGVYRKWDPATHVTSSSQCALQSLLGPQPWKLTSFLKKSNLGVQVGHFFTLNQNFDGLASKIKVCKNVPKKS